MESRFKALVSNLSNPSVKETAGSAVTLKTCDRLYLSSSIHPLSAHLSVNLDAYTRSSRPFCVTHSIRYMVYGAYGRAPSIDFLQNHELTEEAVSDKSPQTVDLHNTN